MLIGGTILVVFIGVKLTRKFFLNNKRDNEIKKLDDDFLITGSAM